MNQEELRLHRCCFTGHLPDKMEFGEREIKPLLEKAIDDAKNKKDVIKVEELPYKDYVWCSDVGEEPWSTRFKLYYGIDEKVKIKMIPNK